MMPRQSPEERRKIREATEKALKQASARSNIRMASKMEEAAQHAERIVQRKRVNDITRKLAEKFRRHGVWPASPINYMPVDAGTFEKAIKKMGKQIYKQAGSPAGVPEELSLGGIHKAVGGIEKTREQLRKVRKK